MLLILSVTVLILASGMRAQAPKTTPKTEAASVGNADNGKKLYKADGCYECHGYEGQGAPGTGTRLAPPMISFPAFVSEVRHPRDQMPPYTAKVLPDSDLADMYAFLQSLPKPPAVKSIPLLNN